MNNHGHMFYMWEKEMVYWLPMLLALGILVYFVSRILQRNEKGTMTQDAPLDLLKRRYSRGEITQEEYEQAQRKILKQGPPSQ